MKSMSSRVLKSVMLMTEPGKASTAGSWAGKQLIMVGTDEPAEEIGVALVRKGVSILRLYDTKQLVRHRNIRSSALAYRAVVLAHCLAKEPGNPQSKIFGYPFRFDWVTAFPCDVAIVINGDRPMCAFCSEYFQQTQTPYLQVSLSPDGTEGQVTVHPVQPYLSDLATDDWPLSSGKAQVYHLTRDARTEVVSLVGNAVDSIIQGFELPWDLARVLSPVEC